ncbi:sialomucin core protein 24-like isoform X2 [Diaphorina citri]|uniref:Sialomucin core protein 24-like isoform X1 n=1 Tax=Diaphorina citri TaxID=121845 RepID=A0A1S4ENU3_DIACI|nr:sialomucin core protein 24-like isoform X1 [Diaphorina citri]XP_017303737.1 sialomucin core protein 24-like isoform X2 [Diaphorina citri]KAI5726475.1 hypothetical protein M8J76_003337 [Diaphorina citri]KAI5731761.1 hypothetical protein M8J77_015583 [Diaphorina citri]
MQSLVHLVVFAFPYIIFTDAASVSVQLPSNRSALQHTSKPSLSEYEMVPQNGTTSVKPPVTPTLPPPPTSPAPTTTSAPVTTAAPYVPEHKFDGASFIGGIVLCAGLTAIGFVSWKFYKARVELTYRTL